MQFIQPSHVMRPARGPLVVGTIVGGVLFVGGLALAWLAFATPIVSGLTPSVVRPTPDQMALGALVWCISLVAPPAFAIVGLIRLWSVVSTVRYKPAVGAFGRVATQLGDQYFVAPSIQLGGGRAIRNVVIGPFGLAIIAEAPPRRATRRNGTVWEAHGRNGRWMAIENPLEKAARDAERVRRWIATEERDFLVKSYAAIVTDDATLVRTPACAVLTSEQIVGWLAALPPQRSLGSSRYADLVEAIRSIA